MKKFTLYLDKEQREALEKQSVKTGAAISELIRRAILAYLKDQSKK